MITNSEFTITWACSFLKDLLDNFLIVQLSSLFLQFALSSDNIDSYYQSNKYLIDLNPLLQKKRKIDFYHRPGSDSQSLILNSIFYPRSMLTLPLEPKVWL